MRTMVLSLAVLAAFGLAGCSGSSGGQGGGAAQSGSSAPAHVASSVSGTVGVRAPDEHTLSDKAVLTIKLVDVSREGGETLDSKKISPVGSLPVNFHFDVNPKKIKGSDLYTVDAEIVDGIRHYTMPNQKPVLTQQAPDHVEIRLKAVPTPAEDLFSAYKDLKAQLGGMKISNGSHRTSKVSRSWQVFRDKDSGQVRYVIELADYVKGGYTETDFAYKDSKPWVVVQKHQSSANAKPHEVDCAGWNEDGKLVLKTKISDGKKSTLSEDKAAKLKKEATSMFERARKAK